MLMDIGRGKPEHGEDQFGVICDCEGYFEGWDISRGG